MFSLGLFLATLEGLLRWQPELFGRSIGNLAFSRYARSAASIYYLEPHARTKFMWPDYRTRAYFNGHWWRHETDAHGFRNPPGLEDRDILLLGDSMTYGHGVEQRQTVANFLRSVHGLHAYDMSRQGACLYQHYVTLRLNLERFAPSMVVLFVFDNDLRDLLQYRTLDELVEVPELRSYDYDQIGRSSLAIASHPPSWLRRGIDSVAVLRLGRALLKQLERKLKAPGSPSTTRRRAPAPRQVLLTGPYYAAALDDSTMKLVAGYYRRILGDLGQRAGRWNTELVVVYLALGREPESDAGRAEHRLDGMLRETTLSLGLPYFQTGNLFRDCKRCILENDGHFTELGHRRLARFLAKSVLLPAGTKREGSKRESESGEREGG